jgi:predicted RNA binding protein YcfA (HicA-like mRNA interferase family)
VTKREKRLQKIRQNPKNVSFEDLQQVLQDHGFILDRVVGSHHTFIGTVDDQPLSITIPAKHPLKRVYVKMALALIDEVRAEKLENEEDEPESHDREDT